MSTSFLLILGVILALGMIAWGVIGMLRGAVITKAYGTVDGERRYYRLVRREEEPVWFWTLCTTYSGVGVVMLVVIYMLFKIPAFSG